MIKDYIYSNDIITQLIICQLPLFSEASNVETGVTWPLLLVDGSKRVSSISSIL